MTSDVRKSADNLSGVSAVPGVAGAPSSAGGGALAAGGAQAAAAVPDPLTASGQNPIEQLPRQFGKYMLMRKLAAGGMAELFLALHRSVAGFEKLLVIKRILPQMNQDQQFIDMLLHEARIAATLSHPNIVQTFDVGQAEGTYFIAMEHIHGEDIRAIVRQMKKMNVTELPIEHALHVVIGLCAGLAYAHEKRDLDGRLLGIVHRDISPQNIVVTFSGDVKVVDFGVAKSLHAGEESKGGHLKGKVPYMSPEQAAGEEIDSRTDVFAAGVILFELTTGKRLFKGASEYDTLKLICESEYPMPSEIAPGYPLALERVVMKALARNKEARYASAREMQADLEAFVRHERLPVSAVTTTSWMQSLFADNLRQQKVDLQDIKQMADEIVMNAPPPDYSPQSTGSHPQFDQSQTGGVLPGAASSIVPASKKSPLPLLGGLALVAALAGGLYVSQSGKTTEQAETAPPVVAAPAPAPDPRGSVKVSSEPAGASIWINGDLHKEVTPTTIDSLPLGQEIRLKISKEGFESHKENLTLEQAAEPKALSVKLETGSVTVLLDIQPEPTVWVDEKPWKGDAKQISGLSADEEHKIVVAAPGYVPKTFTFTGKQGEKKSLKHVMTKMTDAQLAAVDKPGTNATGGGPGKVDPPKSAGTGSVRVNARGGFCSNVTINGASFGPTPVVGSAASGTVRVSCKREDGSTQSQAVPLEPGGTARVSF